jgi:hypothetical protein
MPPKRTIYLSMLCTKLKVNVNFFYKISSKPWFERLCARPVDTRLPRRGRSQTRWDPYGKTTQYAIVYRRNPSGSVSLTVVCTCAGALIL